MLLSSSAAYIITKTAALHLDETPADNDMLARGLADTSARRMHAIASSVASSDSGTEHDVQTLYPGPPKCKCCINWVEEYPTNLKSSIEEQPESKRKALVNQHIKDLLGEVFQGYGGIAASLNKLVFRAPFHPFYHRWVRFQDLLAQKKQEDANAAAYSQLLYNVLEQELRETMEEANDLCAQRVITYELLWTLFEPGTLVYSTMNGVDQLARVQSFQPETRYSRIDVTYTDYDGHKFGYATTSLYTSSFEGTENITSLDVHPMSFHEEEDLMKAALLARGKWFYDLRGVQHRAYRGSCLLRAGLSGQFRRKNINGRIVIDASLAPPAASHGSMGSSQSDQTSYGGYTVPATTGLFRKPFTERIILTNLTAKVGERGLRSRCRWRQTLKPQLEPSEEQLMLSNGSVRAYSLTDKCWGLFSVDSVTDIEWNDDAFPSLRLPEGHKDLILAFVEGQLSDSQPFDDIIQGKGLGLTMLLVGSPGIGKTLTAEAVADKLRKPLYMMSAGELGQSVQSVEGKLSNVLEMTEAWGAILLLDECDVFLEKRSPSNLGHNEIVAVFLRWPIGAILNLTMLPTTTNLHPLCLSVTVPIFPGTLFFEVIPCQLTVKLHFRTLEYYAGMLFLTTNRGDAIDEAFQSRIHLTLHYPELSADAKFHIWDQFLSRVPSSDLSPIDMLKLASLPLNGRQIKNIVKTASLLAKSQQSASIQVKHIETVLEVTNQSGDKAKQECIDNTGGCVQTIM
ncbi:hypothetical protein PG993_011657 [Apiospora rasikravindrae]|uniref:AAA+ ATPase domain-containing protein n=1 Tax=Apiospora rasikravindrae TaxID=990691 RepID=A0ABR1S084_9PEZI